MKKVLILSAFALCLSVFYFVSCQKDSSISEASHSEIGLKEDRVVADRGPNIIGTVTTFCACKQGRSCAPWAYTTTKRNAVKVVLNTTTHNYYNASGPGLRYQIYSGASCGGAAIADFNCNLSTVEYANTLLANGGTYSLIITAPGAASQCYVFTNGTCNGQSCMISSEK